jgi:16S rRNA (uracil1498-N3)-methyltransferase
MNEPRFYAPRLDPSSDEVSLAEDESRHLSKVLRLGPGALVRVFDGAGREVRAEVVAVSKQAVRLRIVEPVEPARELSVRITLAQAVLKGETMDAVVRDATMLGVDVIAPIITTRTIVPARAASATAVVDRWRRIAIAAAKQCGRARVPTIEAARAVDEVLAALPAPRLILVEPSTGADPRGGPSVEPPPAITLFVGPEGGWSAGELDRARAAGALAWRLSPMTLRAEIAPIAALSILTWLWDRKAESTTDSARG